MTPSRTLFYLCLSFIAGIFLESITRITQLLVWGILVSGVLLITITVIWLYHKSDGRQIYGIVSKNFLAVLGFCFLFLSLGILRLQISEFKIASDILSRFNDRQEKINLRGEVIAEPDARDTVQRLKVKVDGTNSTILVTVQRYPEYRYLDKVQVTGKLKSPAVFPTRAGGEDFNYKNYLLKDGIYSVMDFPEIELVSKGHRYNVISFLYEKILFLKGRLYQLINLNFSPPQSFILEGILLGDTSNMPEHLKDKFRATGLVHLTAISGSNVIILSSILMAFLLALGFWRGQAFYLATILIWLYILVAGLPASGIRAAIMASILLLSQKLGRQNVSSRVIVTTATLMVLHNPLLLFYDIGFQLSFLASMGIIYLKPVVDNFFYPQLAKGKEFKNLMDIISITIATQIFTLPLITFYFENISLMAPLTNLLVIPIVNWIMIFGFLVSILGMFSDLAGFIFSIPTWFLLTYFFKVMDVFYQPWSVKSIGNISWVWLVIYYLPLAALIRHLNKFQKQRFFSY